LFIAACLLGFIHVQWATWFAASLGGHGLGLLDVVVAGAVLSFVLIDLDQYLLG